MPAFTRNATASVAAPTSSSGRSSAGSWGNRTARSAMFRVPAMPYSRLTPTRNSSDAARLITM